MKQRKNYQEAQVGDKSFNAEEVQNILLNSIPGKDYPIFSMDYMPQTSFKCNGPNIHYPGYYADVETGCQVFHYCPIMMEQNNYQPKTGYQQQPEEEQYRKKRNTYGQQESPDSYGQQVMTGGYGHYHPEEPKKPKYSVPKPKPTYRPTPKYEQPPPQMEERTVYEPQHYEQEGELISFLCPNQTIFNQQTLVCEWFFNVVCDHAIQNYDLANSRLYHEDAPLLDEIPPVEHPSNLPTLPAPRQPQQGDYQQQQTHHMPHMPRRPAPQPPRYNQPKY